MSDSRFPALAPVASIVLAALALLSGNPAFSQAADDAAPAPSASATKSAPGTTP